MTGTPLGGTTAVPRYPWRESSGEADLSQVLAWRQAGDQRHDDALRHANLALAAASEPAPPALAAGVSVVVTAGDSSGLARCLEALAAQTLDRNLFEVIVVGEDRAGIREITDRARTAHDPVTVRLVRLGHRDAGLARDAGAAAAGRVYTTFVDGRDTVAPEFLEALLAHAGPRVVPVASVIDTASGSQPPAAAIGPTGPPIPLGELGPLAAMPEGKLLATWLARAIRHHSQTADDDLVFWATAAVERGVTFRPSPPAAGSGYYRSARPAPAVGPVTTLDHAVRRVDLIATLERLAAGADPSTRDLLQRRIRAEAELVGGHLRRHPVDHGELVTVLDRTPTLHFPYARMNGGLDRGLVIAYAFPPYVDASGIVMAKRVRTRGRPVDVVYNTMDRIREIDQTIRRISGPYTCDEAPIPSPTWFSNFSSMAEFTASGMEKIQEWTAAKGPYKWLYSRAHFAASHLLAATYKLTNPAVTWTAEFSDPLSRGRLDEEMGTRVEEGAVVAELRAGLQQRGLPVPDSTNCLVWCEEVTYALADELIFTNENQLAYMLGYCGSSELAAMARKKAVVTPHPTLSPEFYSMVDADYPLEEGVAHLAYFGVFYATRGLDDVLTAIADTDASTRSQLRVHVFTTDPAPLRDRAAELGIQRSVRVGRYVGFLEFLNLTTKFDCLIVNDAATREYQPCNPYLPSKWSDYKGSGTPVWGLVEEGSPLSRQPLSYSSPVGDVAAAREVLSRIVRGKVAGQASTTSS